MIAFDVAGGVVIGSAALILIVGLPTPHCDRLRLQASPPPRSRPRHRSPPLLSKAMDALDRGAGDNAGLLPRNAVDPQALPGWRGPPPAVVGEDAGTAYPEWDTGEFAALVLDDRGRQ